VEAADTPGGFFIGEYPVRMFMMGSAQRAQRSADCQFFLTRMEVGSSLLEIVNPHAVQRWLVIVFHYTRRI